MGRTVMTAALLAAFAIPAFADDATMKKDEPTDPTTTSAVSTVSKEPSTKPVYVEDGRSDCMKRHKSAMNMM